MTMVDIFLNMHPKTQHKFTELMTTASLIHSGGHGDWRTYLTIARNRTVGRLRSILETVLAYNDVQFESFVSKIGGSK